ncbi:MAG: RHS repeat-associated core domain-containing protein [Anaerolineae bacterium]|nr:RHS repeat-associated core domain-containing protein [Anaerolineae bacterium]
MWDSASLLVNSSNNPVAGSRTWYLPFGGYRTGSAPTQTITDRDFTGQKENMELGLLYYNARYYVPGLGRFASADTIIPNPTNPQSYNRYSYVENRPLLFKDPTGHISCTDSNLPGGDQLACTSTPPTFPPPPDPLPAIPTGDMVTFNVGCPTCTAFTDAEIAALQESATLTGTRLAETLNSAHGWNLSASEAFLLVYGGSVNFIKTGTQCGSRCWGETFLRDGRHEIEVYTDANIAGDAQWGVHELGHAFINVVGSGPLDKLRQYQKFFSDFPNRPHTDNPNYDNLSPWGFAGGYGTWQRSKQGRASEEFADMYLGWVYNQWEGNDGDWTIPGQYRADFMNSLMPLWVDRW